MVEKWQDRLEMYGLDSLTLVFVTSFLFFSLVSLGLVLHMFYFGYRLKKRTVILQNLRNGISDLVAEYLSEGLDIKETEKKIEAQINSREKKRLLLDFFLDTTDHFKGENRTLFRDLFYQLKLHDATVKLLKSRSWDKKVKGAKLAGKFKVDEAFSALTKLQSTNRKLLRSEIRAALLQLNDFRWIHRNFSRVSDWDQVLILEKLKRERIGNVLNGKEWLSSRHPSMVVFGIRLCYLFNDFESVEQIKSIITERREKPIILEGLKALKFLYPFEFYEIAEELMKIDDSDIKNSVLELLGHDGSLEAVEIIERFIQADYIPTQLVALRALKIAGRDLFKYTHGRYIDVKLIEHINDEKNYIN